jgi:probable lipoprotein NlpC
MKTKPRQNLNIRFLLILIVIISAVFFSSCSSTKKIRNQNINKVIDTARSYRGTPYRYGGTTRSGIDCSALIFHSFQPVGINMPRTSEAQSKMGKKVNGSKLEKGDLVFFSTGKSRKKVSHAGIVTDTSRGRVIFIHSSTSLGVTEDNLDHSYWSKAFRFGRRVF